MVILGEVIALQRSLVSIGTQSVYGAGKCIFGGELGMMFGRRETFGVLDAHTLLESAQATLISSRVTVAMLWVG